MNFRFFSDKHKKPYSILFVIMIFQIINIILSRHVVKGTEFETINSVLGFVMVTQIIILLVFGLSYGLASLDDD